MHRVPRTLILAWLFALIAGWSLAEASTTVPGGTHCTCPLCLGLDIPRATLVP
jgi:hypothetical protein